MAQESVVKPDAGHEPEENGAFKGVGLGEGDSRGAPKDTAAK